MRGGMSSVSPPSNTQRVPQRLYASRMKSRTRSGSSTAAGYCSRMKLSVRTAAGTPLAVFQSASGWNAGTSASLVMIR